VVGPHSRLFGGSAVGIITSDRMGYEGFQAGVAAIATGGVRADMFLEGGPTCCCSMTSSGGGSGVGLSMTMATPLIAGMGEVLGEWPAMAGAGLLGDMQFNPVFQWFDDRIVYHSAMALALTGGVRMDTIIMHGCAPSNSYKTITKADGNVVLEFDGRPRSRRLPTCSAKT
jgi:small ligand-binding sensory domain FIST